MDLLSSIRPFFNSFYWKHRNPLVLYGLHFRGFICLFCRTILDQKKSPSNSPDRKLMDIVVFGAMGVVIGGRLGYCLFYSPDLFLDFKPISFSLFKLNISLPFWGVLKVYQGGMASHGGIIGFLVSQVLYAYRHKIVFFFL